MKVGCLYRVGGKKGAIMRCVKIDGDSAVFESVNYNATFYYHIGDCSLIPVREFEQLSLFSIF